MKPQLELTEAREQLLSTTGNLIVLGGPGSGKTTIALVKAGHEIKTGTIGATQKILFLSFARATVSRVGQHAATMLTPSQLGLLEINTYHGFIWTLLRSHAYLLRGGEAIKLLPPPQAAARLSNISGEVERTTEKRRLFADEGLLHFDLFAEKAAELLSKSKALSSIISRAYPIIILDEFQDTNSDEWNFIRNLSCKSRVIALADAEQRIYEFRGADPKRIGEFIAEFTPDAFDFGTENHRSNGTDIGIYGNELLTGKNKGKKYTDVIVFMYGFYAGKHHLFPLKAFVLQSMKRLIGAELPEWSIAILVPTKQLMFQVSDYLDNNVDGFPPVQHEVALDSEAPALAAVLIASLLEGGTNPQTISTRFLQNLCTHIRGRKGSKPPSQADLELVNALEAYTTTGKIRGSKRKAVIDSVTALGEARMVLKCTGDAALDWLTIREMIYQSNVPALQQIATDAKYLRLLHKGAVLRSALGELWRKKGTYQGAESAVRDALLQEHFSSSLKPWHGIHIMTIHKSKGKEFSEVVIYEGSHQGKIRREGCNESQSAQALLALRVAVTRAMRKATILTPERDPCPFL